MFRIYDMKVICAWCGEYLRTVKAISPGKISHGICEDCKANLLKEHEDSKKKVA